MEIEKQLVSMLISVVFKIDLIVWKFNNRMFPWALPKMFKIDLIVWKSLRVYSFNRV